MISSLTCSKPSRAQHVERLDQPLEVLVRLDVAGIQHERVVQLVALADALDLLGGRRFAEALVDRVVDDVDLLLGDVEVLQDVPLRRLRDRQHAIGAVGRSPQRRSGISVGQPARQILRKPQVDAVVDGDDRPARRSAAAARSAARGTDRRARAADRAGCAAARGPNRPGPAPGRPGSSARASATDAQSSDGRAARTRSSRRGATGAAAGSGCRCRCRSRAACARRWRFASPAAPGRAVRAPDGPIEGNHSAGFYRGSCPLSRR